MLVCMPNIICKPFNGENEVDTGKEGQRGGVAPLGQEVGNLIPALHGEYFEEGIDGEKGIPEVFRRLVAEENRRANGKDQIQDDQDDKDPHGGLEGANDAGPDPRPVGDELEETEETKEAGETKDEDD